MGVLQHGISCAGIASEELDEMVAFDNRVSMNSKYICMFDPLDGSSNIDVNVSIGTIFSVYRRVTRVGTMARQEDFLQPGLGQVAAGYVIYGSSTILVYATKRGVNGFTLDPSIGEFCLATRGCVARKRVLSILSIMAVFRSLPKGFNNILPSASKRTKLTDGHIRKDILAAW